MNIYQSNYQKISQILPGIFDLKEFVKLCATGAKDLNVHIMARQQHRLVIALSYYRKDASGDLVPEIDFTIALHPTTQTAEVLIYEDRFGYRRVYTEDETAVSQSIE